VIEKMGKKDLGSCDRKIGRKGKERSKLSGTSALSL
jgi:hypothetical protein